MKHSWVVVAWVGPELEEIILRNDLFIVEDNPGFLKPIGITAERSYRPWVVTPKLEVWQEICRRINSETEGQALGRSSQLTFQDRGRTSPLAYSFTVRFYRPGTICIEVNMVASIGSSIEEFFVNRDLSTHTSASVAVDTLLGIIRSGQLKNYPRSNSLSAKPAMLYAAPTDQEHFSEWKEENDDALAGLLINNPRYKLSSDDLTRKIFEKNKELDVKYAKSAFSVVSKQGVLTAYPADGSDLNRDINREHKRRFRFLEYALALQKFTEKYQEIRINDRTRAEFLLFLCAPFLRKDVNLPKTVTGTQTWKILAEEFALERSLDVIENVHLEQSEAQEIYYTQLAPEIYGSINYMKYVRPITRPYRSWIKRDLPSNGIVFTVAGLLIAMIAAAIAFAQ